MPDDRYTWRAWPEQMTVAMRRRKAERRAAELARKSGRDLAPVVITGREIAGTFWGDAWCENLERYSDFANRLPRGRSYLRNGSVIDLRIDPGRVTALVSGTDLYSVEVAVAAGAAAARGRRSAATAAGAIDSVVELLQGRLVHQRDGASVPGGDRALSRAEANPSVLQLSRSRDDVQARGGGALRRSAPGSIVSRRCCSRCGRSTGADLIARAGTGARLGRKRAKTTTGGRRIEDESALGAIFGLDLAPPRRGRRQRTPGVG